MAMVKKISFWNTTRNKDTSANSGFAIVRRNPCCANSPDFALFTFILKNNLSTKQSLRPDLSGALFARRHDEQKSGNGGRKLAPKKIKGEIASLLYFGVASSSCLLLAMTQKKLPQIWSSFLYQLF